MFGFLLFFTLTLSSCLAARAPEDCLEVTFQDGPPPESECKYWIDLNGEPYFLPHRFNCSRFWECEPDGNICLFECASCAPWPNVTPECPSHALFFDRSIQYPFGPVCNWPAIIDCTNIVNNCTLPCQLPDDDFKCQPECCQDADCPEGKPLCNGDGACVIGCRENEDCMNWDGMCPDCQWCDIDGNEDIGKCKPGCLTDDQCSDPTPICDLSDHTCVAPPCKLPCQEWQDGVCQPQCCQDDDCPATTPLCNTDGLCVAGCRTSPECDGYNTVCHQPWQTGDDNCEYCDTVDSDEDIGSCQPGCDDENDKCPAGYVCDGKHLCVDEGATLIKKIHLTTDTCVACSLEEDMEGGAQVRIIGTQAECTTRGLDHNNERDYFADNTADFVSKDDDYLMGGCNNAELKGGPKNTTISWTGQGTWTPKEVRYEVTGEFFYCCTLPSPPPQLAQGDSPVFLTCTDGGDCNTRK